MNKYEVRFIAHNMPFVNGAARTRLMSFHATRSEAEEAALQYAGGAARSIGGTSGRVGDSVAVYVDGHTLWSEFYVQEVAA